MGLELSMEWALLLHLLPVSEQQKRIPRDFTVLADKVKVIGRIPVKLYSSDTDHLSLTD